MPYRTEAMAQGDSPSVLALSWGKGDPHKDPISIVFLDEAGRLREHTRVDNLFDDDNKDEFRDILKRRQPTVIAVGGFSMATTKLFQRVKEMLHPVVIPDGPEGSGPPAPRTEEESFDIPVIYVFDEVARMYQHSKRAEEEFSALTPTAKYCIGLARYTQSPLNEYASLGSDITAINFDDKNQSLVRCLPMLFVTSMMTFAEIRYPKRSF